MPVTTTRFSQTTLDALVEQLHVKHDMLARCAESLRSDAADALSEQDLSDLFDEDGPRLDSDPAPALMLAYRAERRLSDVGRALERVADDTYGSCIHCGSSIPLDRLRALPATASCVECSRQFPFNMALR